MNLTNLYAAHDAKRAELKAMNEKIEKREAALERLRAKRDELWDSFSWVSMLVDPLAEALAEYPGANGFETFGPFGLRAATSIHLYKNEKLGHITLTLEDGKRLNYDTGEKCGNYASGSLGNLNGFDNVTASLPDSIPEIAELLHWYDNPRI